MIEDKNFKVGNLCVQFASFHIFMQYISRWASFLNETGFFASMKTRFINCVLTELWARLELFMAGIFGYGMQHSCTDAVLVFLHNPSRGSTHNFDQCRRSWLFPAKKVSTVVNHFMKLKTPCSRLAFIWNSISFVIKEKWAQQPFRISGTRNGILVKFWWF